MTATVEDRPAAGRSGADPALIVRYCEIAVRAGDPDRAAARLGTGLDGRGHLTEGLLLRIYRLGEQLGAEDVAADAIRGLGALPALSATAANFILQRAHAAGDPELRTRVARGLQRRILPAQRTRFQILSDDLTSGPDAALAVARQGTGRAKTSHICVQIGQCLTAAGRSGLAVRYLRHCLRRWPGSPTLRAAAIDACVRSGLLAEGHAILDRIERAAPGIDLDMDRIRLLTEGEALEQALDIAERRREARRRTLTAEHFVRHNLALGRFDAALREATASRMDIARTHRRLAHFNVSHIGALLNEEKIYRLAAAHRMAQGETEDAVNAELCEDYYYPAQHILDRLPGDAVTAPPIDRPAIPRRILQYWNTPTIPDEVRAVMETWESVPGFEYCLYDRARARAFLIEHFGPAHDRAFRLANHVAEECDFLRLCLLLHEGGLYVDADDRRVGDPNAVLSLGRDLILFREPYRAICNNVICAAPGHPVLKIAVGMALRSLLSRENDAPWSKTGPGLLTRATATYLRDRPDSDAARTVSILPRHRLKRYVDTHVRLSYKLTVKHWNGSDRVLPRRIADAMCDLDQPQS